MASPERLPIVVVACRVFEGLIQQYLPEGVAEEITFLDYGLHRVPAQLTWTVQDVLDGIETPSLIVLGYGLCGNGLAEVKAGKHTLLIPRADDCIAILLGSYKAYIEAFEQEPGTYYLTKGWLESGSDPLKEYHEVVEKYGQADADWIMDQQYRHYSQVVFIAHSQQDLDEYGPQAREVARFCERWGWTYKERLGSDGYVRRLLQAAQNPDPNDRDFLIVPPGGEIKQGQFMR